ARRARRASRPPRIRGRTDDRAINRSRGWPEGWTGRSRERRGASRVGVRFPERGGGVPAAAQRPSRDGDRAARVLGGGLGGRGGSTRTRDADGPGGRRDRRSGARRGAALSMERRALTETEIARRLAKPLGSTRAILDRLELEGLAERDGDGWRLTEEG